MYVKMIKLLIRIYGSRKQTLHFIRRWMGWLVCGWIYYVGLKKEMNFSNELLNVFWSVKESGVPWTLRAESKLMPKRISRVPSNSIVWSSKYLWSMQRTLDSLVIPSLITYRQNTNWLIAESIPSLSMLNYSHAELWFTQGTLWRTYTLNSRFHTPCNI